MWHLDDQTVVMAEYRLPTELNIQLQKASAEFGVEEEKIVIQALREFFEKHGIRAPQTTA